jgi:4-amino-4-deoxy-L-arabinose transferase-like glycosyltransferase
MANAEQGRGLGWLKSDHAALVLIALARLAFHIFTSRHYGFHRDELQTLDDARHLDWGFVAYPPITPLIARLELGLFGASLAGFRFFSAAAVAFVMVIGGWIAKELGGKRQVQLLAAFAVGISPISLAQGAVFQYVAFDYLWGVLATYFLVRLLNTEDARWWLAVGLVLGLGMQTRYTAGFWTLGIVGGVLATSARKYLRSPWLWLGVAISLVIFLPNLWWQASHDFIARDFLRHIHERDIRIGRTANFLPLQLVLAINVTTVPLLILGLWFFWFARQGRRYRLLGWSFAISMVLFAAGKARFYYSAPCYPVILAGGAVVWGGLLDGLRERGKRSVRGALSLTLWGAMMVGAVVFGALVTPIAPLGSWLWKITARVHDQFREEIGWDDLAEAVARVYRTLPPSERAETGILTGNYGEGGALNLYGPSLGLPRAMSLTNSFWYRGYDTREPRTVIVVGFDLEEAQELFASCSIAARNTNSQGVVNEESRDHPDILVCRNLKERWANYWRRSRRFG